MEFHDIDKVPFCLYNRPINVEFHEFGGDMIISFAGHAQIPTHCGIKEIVKEQLRCLVGKEKISCYLGGYGDFDEICARACKELQEEFMDIECVIWTYPHKRK